MLDFMHVLQGFGEAFFGNLVWISYMNWKYNKNFTNKKLIYRTIIALGGAYIWLVMNMPNSFNLFLVGMVAPEIIGGVIEKHKGEDE